MLHALRPDEAVDGRAKLPFESRLELGSVEAYRPGKFGYRRWIVVPGTQDVARVVKLINIAPREPELGCCGVILGQLCQPKRGNLQHLGLQVEPCQSAPQTAREHLAHRQTHGRGGSSAQIEGFPSRVGYRAFECRRKRLPLFGKTGVNDFDIQKQT